jgi:hypothetical protein
MAYGRGGCGLVGRGIFDRQLPSTLEELVAAEYLKWVVPLHLTANLLINFILQGILMSDQVAQFEKVQQIEEEVQVVNVYAWGSAECDQFDFGKEDDEPVSEKMTPFKLTFF